MKHFNKHPQESNKKFDQVQLNEERWQSKKRSKKNYITAQKKAMASLRLRNDNVEALYHSMLRSVKALYNRLPKKEDRVIVELDMKKHPLEVDRMHAFLTPHFMFFLECDCYNQYRIEYCISQCPLHNEIMELLNKYAVDSCSTMVRKLPSYQEFYNEVLRVQPERFIKVL